MANKPKHEHSDRDRIYTPEQIVKTLIAIGALILIIGVICLIMFAKKLDVENAYIQCCNGMICSDTYYTGEDNLCHLSLCESSPFTNKKDCVYEGANISINST